MTEKMKLLRTKEPFIRKADHKLNTHTMMRDFVYALIPLIVFAWLKNGLLPFINGHTNFWGMIYPLILVIVGAGSSLLYEYIWYSFIVKTEDVGKKLKNSFAIIPGLLLAMIVPLATPIWVLLLGTFFATVVGKLIFGGFGSNVFNPALVGYLFLTFAYYAVINREFAAIGANGVFNGTENLIIVSGATPLTNFAGNFAGYEEMLATYSILDLFLGLNPGALAETSALLCLVALIFLIVRKTIKWTIPVFFLGTVFILSYIIGAMNGYTDLSFALFHLFTGGLMFGAVFMATEPVTSPRNPNGRIIYAIGMGVLTVVFRFASNSPEGVAISILIMNMFTPIVEGVAGKLRVSKSKRKVAITYAAIVLLFGGISTFAVTKYIPEGEAVGELPVISFKEVSQGYDNLEEFEYIFLVDGEEVVVTTRQNYSIKSISNEEYNNDEVKAELQSLVNSNKLSTYILEVNETSNETIVTVKTRGYGGNPAYDVLISFDNDNKFTSFIADTSKETYRFSQGWDQETEPGDFIGGQILDNPENLDDLDIVSGATVTSNYLIAAAKNALDYMNHLTTATGLKLTGLSQDYSDLGFVYYFRNDGVKVVVETDADYVITSTGAPEGSQAIIDANKFVDYVKSVDPTKKTFVVISKGFGANPPIETTFTYDDDHKIIAVSIEHAETYYEASVEIEVGLPDEIINNQDNLDDFTVISGATVSSNSVKRAAIIALDYLSTLGGASNE